MARFIARYFAAGGLPGRTPEAVSLDAPQAMLATPGAAGRRGLRPGPVSETSDSAASPAAPDEAASAAAPASTPAAIDPFGQLLTPLTLRTAGERIAERFVTAIALGEFVPGQQLPSERELAAMLEVSRTTVREALQRLHAAGYVTTRRGRGGGTFVQTGVGPAESDEMIRRTLLPAWDELSEILDFRQLIEQQIARTAAERRDDDDIKVIREAVEAYERRPEPGGIPARRRRGAPGHHPGRAQHAADRAERRGSAARSASGSTPSRTRQQVRRRALHQHPELAEAVIAGDAGDGRPRGGPALLPDRGPAQGTSRSHQASVRRRPPCP